MNETTTTTATTTIPRWKNWTLWTGILSALWLLLSAFGVPAKIGMTDETFNTAVSVAGTILTILGVMVNPTTSGVTD